MKSIGTTTTAVSFVIAILFFLNLTNGVFAFDCFGLLPTDPLVCSTISNGICTAQDTCSCTTGWTGSTCAIPLCLGAVEPVACNSGNGVCTAPEVCTCNTGWTGPTCAIPLCLGATEPTACNGANGVCIAPGVCTCNTGWTGATCGEPLCSGLSNPTACNGANGVCIAPGVCSCITGWTGATCATPLCLGAVEPTACNGANGVCTAPEVCTCNTGWTGATCGQPLCSGTEDPIACNGANGVCISPGVCSCSSGYSNTECQDFFCNAILFSNLATVCSAHGTCVAPDVCNCSPAYTGTFCNIPICFGLAATNPAVCGGNGGIGTCVAPDTCTCIPGYTGNQCQYFQCDGLASTDPTACSGTNGMCTGVNTCTCSTGYALPDCSGILCQGIINTSPTVCSTHGTCAAPDSCSCTPGYTGADCSINVCDGLPSTAPTVCNSNGICTAPNTCVCDPGFTGQYCQTTQRQPPTLCIVDGTIATSHVDFGYIYFHSLSSAIIGCRSQPVEHIKVSNQTAIIDSDIVFTRNNFNQTELLIEPLLTVSTVATDNAENPIIVGINHILTVTFEKITIRNVNFMSLDFPGGAVNSPGGSGTPNDNSIFKGTANSLQLSNLQLRSMVTPTAVQSITNEPNVDYLIFIGVHNSTIIKNIELFGSRKNALEIIDLNGLTQGAVGNSITIENTVGQGDWGGFLFLSGVQNVTLISNACTELCGGVFQNPRVGMITVHYKPTILVGTLGSYIHSDIRLNDVGVNLPIIQNVATSSGTLSGFYLKGTGPSTATASIVSASLNDTTMILRDNRANGYPNGLRISGLLDDFLRLNYPIGWYDNNVLAYDALETLRETARLNSVNLTSIGDFQGTAYDVIDSLPGSVSTVATNDFCNDFCIPDDLCCDVNSQFTQALTPGFGTIKFPTVTDAMINRPGGCNITQTITRCIRLTRGSGIGNTDPWIHTEDFFFDTNENLILLGEINPVNNGKVRVIGNHSFTRGLSHKITIRDIRFQPSALGISVFNTVTFVGSGNSTPQAMLYDITFNNLYISHDFSNPIPLVIPPLVGGGNSVINLIDMSGNTITISDTVVKPGLVGLNTPVIRLEFKNATSSDCGVLIFNNNQIEQPLDNAMTVLNVAQITMLRNKFFECGAGATATSSIVHFACIYIRMCIEHPPLSVPQIIGNEFTGASTLQLQSTKVTYKLNNNVHYTMLWLDTDIQLNTVGVLSPHLGNITSNEYSGIVPVRERINGVVFNLPTTIANTERAAIRSLNIKNSGSSTFQDTVFNVNDNEIELKPGTTLIFYCTNGCKEVDFNKLHTIMIVAAILLTVTLTVLIFIIGIQFCFDNSDDSDGGNDDYSKSILSKNYKWRRKIEEIKLKEN